MTVTAMAAGSRFGLVAISFAGALAFGVFAIGKPLWFLVSGAPVNPGWAVHAWAGPLAGLPMAAFGYLAIAVAVRLPDGQAEWELFAERCLRWGLWGLGVGAVWAAAALGIALALQGQSTVDLGGAGIVKPMIGILSGLAFVTLVNLLRMPPGGAWLVLGPILWGFFGVVALAVGLPMVAEAIAIDDARALKQRFNLFIVFYPLLWLAYAAIASAIVVCGVRWLRFALNTYQRNEVSPSPAGDTWPVTYDASPDIRNRAA